MFCNVITLERLSHHSRFKGGWFSSLSLAPSGGLVHLGFVSWLSRPLQTFSLYWIMVLIWTFCLDFCLGLDPPWSSRRTPAAIGSSPKASAAVGRLRWCLQETWTRPAGSRVWRHLLTWSTACAPPAAAHGHDWVPVVDKLQFLRFIVLSARYDHVLSLSISQLTGSALYSFIKLFSCTMFAASFFHFYWNCFILVIPSLYVLRCVHNIYLNSLHRMYFARVFDKLHSDTMISEH